MLGAIIGGLGSIAGGLFGSSGAKSAARAQAAAQQAAIDEQRRQFDLTREDMAPWRAAGEGALNRLQDPQSAFQASPGYDYALGQSQQAIERARSATGGLASGNTLAALQQNAIGLANQDYGNWWNQQAGLAGVGQNATNQLAQLGAQTSGNIGNLMAAQGDARASGIAGSANAWGNALGTLGSIGYNYFNNPAGSTAGSVVPYRGVGGYNPDAAGSPWAARNLLGDI